MNKVRAKAWATRREKYGERGHSGTYSRSKHEEARVRRMEDAIIKLYDAGVLSEGQAVQITGLDRIEVRKRADALPLKQGDE